MRAGTRIRALAAACLLAVPAAALAGCATSRSAAATVPAGVISAVAAESQYASVLSQVGGRYVRVAAILDSPSADPHSFELSPQVAREVSTARIIVQNGAGYDSWISRIEAAAPSPGRRLIVVQHLLHLPDSTPNPHLWYDPKAMPAAARAMAADLAAIEPAHRAYFQANLRGFDTALQPWLTAIARFRAARPGVTAATTEPVADYLLTAMGIRNLTPFSFQADIMNGVDPSPEDIAAEDSVLSQHQARLFAYNAQVADSLTTSIRQAAIRGGTPVVAVYETMPAGYSYQSWMLAETTAISRAVTSSKSSPRL